VGGGVRRISPHKQRAQKTTVLLILAKPRGNAAQKLTAAATRGKARVPRALVGALGGTNQFAGRVKSAFCEWVNKWRYSEAGDLGR
jgi:hypothetical protein